MKIKSTPRKHNRRERRESSGIDHLEMFRHHSNLFWQVTSLFTTALGGLLLYLAKNPNIVLSILGISLLIALVYFAASLRILKQDAFNKAEEKKSIKKCEPHLPQWPVYLILWGGMGIIFILFFNLEMNFIRQLNCLQYVGLIIWIGYVVFMGVKFNKKKK